MRSHPFLLPALTTSLLMISSVARADVEKTHVDVVCDAHANVALVRFATSYNDDPVEYPRLPRNLDRGVSGASGSDRSDCSLPDDQAEVADEANRTASRPLSPKPQALHRARAPGPPISPAA